jgi:hypothetical protein
MGDLREYPSLSTFMSIGTILFASHTPTIAFKRELYDSASVVIHVHQRLRMELGPHINDTTRHSLSHDVSTSTSLCCFLFLV